MGILKKIYKRTHDHLFINWPCGSCTIPGSCPRQFVLAEAKKKGGKPGLQGTGGIKSYLSNRTVYTFNSKERDY